MLVEAKWYYEGYTPSLQEYLNNGWITLAGKVLSDHSFFVLMHDDPEEIITSFLGKHQDLVYYVSIIGRLCNDLATSRILNLHYFLGLYVCWIFNMVLISTTNLHAEEERGWTFIYGLLHERNERFGGCSSGAYGGY